jgi:hypothetical protein
MIVTKAQLYARNQHRKSDDSGQEDEVDERAKLMDISDVSHGVRIVPITYCIRRTLFSLAPIRLLPQNPSRLGLRHLYGKTPCRHCTLPSTPSSKNIPSLSCHVLGTFAIRRDILLP